MKINKKEFKDIMSDDGTTYTGTTYGGYSTTGDVTPFSYSSPYDEKKEIEKININDLKTSIYEDILFELQKCKKLIDVLNFTTDFEEKIKFLKK